MTERIAARIRQDVEAYAGPPHGRRQRMIQQAVTLAVADFIDSFGEGSVNHDAVDAHFRKMGFGLATEGRGIGAMNAAFQVAFGDVWKVISRVTSALGLSGETVAALGSHLTSYLEHLNTQVRQGYLAGREAALDPRERLCLMLVSGDPGAPVTELAEAAGWPLPERLVVLVVDCGGEIGLRQAAALPDAAIACLLRGRLVVMTAEADLPAVREHTLRLAGTSPVAIMWPMPVADARNACRWAHRALRLRRAGRITAAGQVVECAEHRTALVLGADVQLLEHHSMRLLAPLLELKPHQRLMLAETLRHCLETQESAPLIAQRLGRHPQTVRNRIRRLHDLFGDRLVQPADRMELILALEAALPSWRTSGVRR